MDKPSPRTDVLPLPFLRPVAAVLVGALPGDPARAPQMPLWSMVQAMESGVVVDAMPLLPRRLPRVRALGCCRNLTYFIQTPDKVAAEYQVEALVLNTGKIYKQTYAGVLHAENGKIKLLREALDTVAASNAFTKD